MSETLTQAQALTGEPLRERLLAQADLICKKKVEEASERYSDLEKSTWTEKRRQALLYLQTQNPLDAPSLKLEAENYLVLILGRNPTEQETSLSLQELATGIQQQADQIEWLQSFWISWRSATRSSIAALSIEQLSSFSIVVPDTGGN